MFKLNKKLIKRDLLILLLSSFGFCNQLYSQSRYNFIYEPNLGMKFGAENIVSSHYLWGKFDNLFIPNEIFKKKNFSTQIGNISYRLTKLFLIDYPLTFVLPSIQHERIGHGTRVTEFGGTINQVNIVLPPPFQGELPNISYDSSNLLTPQQDIMITIGGSESNEVLGNIVRKNILLDNELDYHNAFLYLYANNDLSGYAGFASNISESDIRTYVTAINSYYGNSELTLKKIQLYGVLSIILDPINHYAFNSLFNGYLRKGKNKSKIHLIGLTDNLKYLPKLKFGLTPFGPELTFQNYFKHNNRLYSFSFGSFDGTFENFWRLGAEVWNVKLNDQFSINFSGQIWNQQNIDFYVNDQLEISESFGGLFINTVNYDFYSKKNRLGLTLQFGYKSKGFSVGEKLNHGLIVRGGLTFTIKPENNKP